MLTSSFNYKISYMENGKKKTLTNSNSLSYEKAAAAISKYLEVIAPENILKVELIQVVI